ncbi:flavin reductase family protein [Aquabacterium sp. OR-4]|uniref:flavin reductase family protein n=1 Tax=Aquabacterium sp. OR-4 TaxID=2978127 RepID=UPI0021B4A1B1|nr:flavin reductase family protein [Aquabacterium sp. OR-4]MDT7835521.1 flavin reductase family protein [Aquabacterium sp. OR-4]
MSIAIVEPSSAALRQALGRFATGVVIVTCRDAAGRPLGLTVNSFAALSLQPPLVLWSLRRASAALAAFEAATHWAVNVLTEAQLPLSRRFASAEPDKFAEGDWADGLGDVPLLGGAAAVFECGAETVHDGGDHRLFIGRVLRLDSRTDVDPLVYHAGHYHGLSGTL